MDHYSEIAESIEREQGEIRRKQKELDLRVRTAALKHIAKDTSGKVFDVVPIKFQKAGAPPELTRSSGQTLTSAEAIAILKGLGELDKEVID